MIEDGKIPITNLDVNSVVIVAADNKMETLESSYEKYISAIENNDKDIVDGLYQIQSDGI